MCRPVTLAILQLHGANALALEVRACSIPAQPMSAAPSEKGFFEPTLWSTILKAKEGEEQTRFAALERMAERYRHPIILHIQYVRRCNELEAEELAHEFLAHWMAKDFLANVEREKGRFRTFIKSCVRNFLVDLGRHDGAGIRNPQGGIVSLDETNGEGAPLVQPPSGMLAPGDHLDVAWAHELVARAMASLERECVQAKHGALFAALKPTMSGEPDAEQHAVIAAKLGTSEGAIKVAFYRLKKRLGELIREEVRETVGSREDWEAELRYLIELLGK